MELKYGNGETRNGCFFLLIEPYGIEIWETSNEKAKWDWYF